MSSLNCLDTCVELSPAETEKLAGGIGPIPVPITDKLATPIDYKDRLSNEFFFEPKINFVPRLESPRSFLSADPLPGFFG